jgi:hypothetical protein
MGWIDDVARWVAGPDVSETLNRPVSRRGALALFGGTAAAAAAGTLGDPPAAEAIERCCDPDHVGTWSCLDGYECCCYQIPGGGGHNECCDPSVGQSCQAQPGQLDHGVQVRACCYTMCANECCTIKGDVCNSQGYCFSCGDLERCGDECCDPGYGCTDGKCVIRCDPGRAPCGDLCCGTGEDCVLGTCDTKCQPGAVRCDADQHCCDPGQKCVDNACVDCIPPLQPCGSTCCPDGATCCDPARGICCTDPQTCREDLLSCVCADGQCRCGDDCCGAGEYCDPDAGCGTCPGGTTQCGSACCPPGATCERGNYDGEHVCSGHCKCDNGGVICGDRCCDKHAICVAGVCQPCAATADACGDHCCDAPFVCNGNGCSCPEHAEACGGGCCGPDDECVGGRCLPKCDYAESSGRCGDVCCKPHELCLGGVCSTCPPGKQTCGPVCCTPPEECFAAGICRLPATAKAKPPKTVTVEHGTATIGVSCTGGCSGTVTLETTAAHASVLGLIAAKPRRVVLGRAAFKVAKGRTSAKAHVHLSHAGKRYLAKHHGKVKAQALVRTKGQKTSFLTHVFTLASAKPKRKP